MADFAQPTTSALYTALVTAYNDKIDDVAKQLNSAVVTVTNPPTNTVRWNNSTSLWEKNTGTPAAPT